MTESTDAAPIDVKKLVELSEEEKTAKMAELFTNMLSDTEVDRKAKMTVIITEEFDMGDKVMAEMSKARLNSWLAMDKGKAKQIAGDFQAVIDGMPGKIAMRHAIMDQTVSMNYDTAQLTLLAEMDPKVFRSMPGVALPAEADAGDSLVVEESVPWWKFW